MTTLRDIGENALLKSLLPLLPQSRDVLVGPGDDCAVTHLPGMDVDFLFTTDPVIEGRHFLPDTPPEYIGQKALNRCLSDIAAMGGAPCWALVNLVAPGDMDAERIRRVFNGLLSASEKWGISLIGGDTAEGAVLELHVTGVGQIPHGLAVLRSTAKTGHSIFVTGTLGGSYLPGVDRHLLFEPRVEAGHYLAQQGWTSAMMDISDGLGTDLPRLLDASNCGAEIWTHKLPISPEARQAKDERTPLEHAMFDGEDFELLFTVPRYRKDDFIYEWRGIFPQLPVTEIGRIFESPKQRFWVDEHGTSMPIISGGYEHFRTGHRSRQ